jgi:phosphotransferase system enzyme I (PtsP)
MVRSVEAQGLRRYIAQLVEQPDHSVRERLRAYALDHEISI